MTAAGSVCRKQDGGFRAGGHVATSDQPENVQTHNRPWGIFHSAGIFPSNFVATRPNRPFSFIQAMPPTRLSPVPASQKYGSKSEHKLERQETTSLGKHVRKDVDGGRWGEEGFMSGGGGAENCSVWVVERTAVHMHGKREIERKRKVDEGRCWGNRRETLTWLTLASGRSAGKFENSFVQPFGPLVVTAPMQRTAFHMLFLHR